MNPNHNWQVLMFMFAWYEITLWTLIHKHMLYVLMTKAPPAKTVRMYAASEADTYTSTPDVIGD